MRVRRSIRGSRVRAQPYRDLVWLAYLSLPRAAGEERRLVLAHRMSASAVTGRTRIEEVRLRKSFLRRVLRKRLMPWSGRLATVEAVPAVTRSRDMEFTRRFDGLPAPARAAYALLRLEERPHDQVMEILTGAGVDDPAAALAAVSDFEEQAGWLWRPALDPTLVRIYGRPPAGRRLRAAAAAGLCLLALVVVLPQLDLERPGIAAAPSASRPRIVRAAGEAWRAGTSLDLGTWAPRGSLVHDEELVRRAIGTWGASSAQLLFAGQVDDARVVLLRRPSQVARYTETANGPTVEILPEPRVRPDGAGPLKLSTTTEGSRYLLPPWVREVSKATLAGRTPHWHKVEIRDGVTAPVPLAERGGCWQGPVLRLRAPEIAHGLPYTMLDFGRLSLANASYQPPPPAEVNRYGPHELDALPEGFSAWKHVGCAVERPEGEIQAATAWEFWAGQLPEGVRGRWVCLRTTDASGGSVVRGVLLATGRGRTTGTPTAARAGTWDCSRLRTDIVAGVWWKAPSGRRYYVAAGSRRVAAMDVGRHRVSGRHVAIAGSGIARPRLSAVDEAGVKVSALQ